MMIKNQPEFLFKNINIIGLGLIGGSIAKACQNQQISEIISGFDVDKKAEQFALENGLINQSYNFDQMMTDDDLTIIAAPLSNYELILKKLLPQINNSIVIDIGSLKDFAVQKAQDILGAKARNFVACHPIAGSEKSGVENADSQLFLNKKVIITPTLSNDQNAVKKIELLWKKIGCNVDFIDSKTHDKIFALVSHLPQFLAFVIKENYVNGGDEILNRHFRLQNSNSQIWQEIFALNRENIEYYLDGYLKNIDEVLKGLDLQKKIDFIEARKILVSCFLDLSDIDKFKSYAGSGFRDFTAIVDHSGNVDNIESVDLKELLNQIKLTIKNYEFS
jgi:prephenate dehydrogenase